MFYRRFVSLFDNLGVTFFRIGLSISPPTVFLRRNMVFFCRRQPSAVAATAVVCGLPGSWVSRIPRSNAPPRALRHANRPPEECAHMNICVRCSACDGLTRTNATLAFTRYLFTSSLLCMNQQSFCSPPPNRNAHYYNTIGRLLRYTLRPPQLPLCMPSTIQYWQWQYLVKAKRYSVTA